MLPKLILLASLITIAITLLMRWWFGLRILQSTGKRPCRCDLQVWMPDPTDCSTVHRAEQNAAEFGKQLRLKALAEWSEADPKAAKIREKNRLIASVVPPLGLMVALLALIALKFPLAAVIAIFAGATALTSALTLSSLPVELNAINHTIKKIRKQRAFPHEEDESAVCECALAHAWETSAPSFLRWL